MSIKVSDVVGAIARAFPPERAEDWDRGGLLAGDPDEPVQAVALALDPTVETVRQAADAGASVLVTHHPAFLSALDRVTATDRGSRVVFEAVKSGIALVNAHTNLDRDERAQRLTPELLGLEPLGPLEKSPQPRSVVTVFVPAEAAGSVRDAMMAAGAGRIGDYVGCSFAGMGIGSFVPPENGRPWVGVAGEPSQAEEVRLEAVCSRASASAVVRAAAAAHPYEEPLVTVADVAIAPNAAALGMMSSVPGSGPATLGALARVAGRVFGVRPRVWGDPARGIAKVATGTGSASSLVNTAVSAGADVLVAGEVRYHDALDALAGGMCVIEVGHDASEWPLVELLASVVREIPGMGPANVTVLPRRIGWWVPEGTEGA